METEEKLLCRTENLIQCILSVLEGSLSGYEVAEDGSS